MSTASQNAGASEADQLDLTSSTVNQIKAYGGDDNDLFAVSDTQAIDAVFNGGQGDDTYRDSRLLPNRISQLKRTRSNESNGPNAYSASLGEVF